MDFSFTEAEDGIAELAHTILTDHTSNDRLKDHERSGAPYDTDLWRALADAEVLSAWLPASLGGSDLGFVGLARVLEEVGRTVAPVPAFASLVLGARTLLDADPVAHADRIVAIGRGALLATGAIEELASRRLDRPTTRAVGSGSGVRLQGTKTNVAFGIQADVMIVTAADEAGTPGVYLVDAATNRNAIDCAPLRTSDSLPHAQVHFTDTPATPLGGADSLRALVENAIAARCVMAVGVAARALEMTASYGRERQQFDRPIGSFQAFHMRAADAYIQVEAMRLTAWDAVWRLAIGEPAADAVAVAKICAAEAGHITGYATQHLHGGIGIDVDYPLHRYFQWSIQLQHELGSGHDHLAELGATIAARSLPFV